MDAVVDMLDGLNSSESVTDSVNENGEIHLP
jgi:hypothetical protein